MNKTLVVILNIYTKPNNIENQILIFLVYDIETYNDNNKTTPYHIGLYRLGKLTARYNRDLSRDECEKSE